ncbi:MAG: methyltransferase domain-containing protein [Anaerotruncus sp.]|nr:methyltransferase domain-containing protein [Anaerotruncus sp.]
MGIRSFGAVSIAHKIIAEHVPSGGFCIDATAGRGNDTAFLAQLVGEKGRVLAFDIQQEAIDSTCALLAERGLSEIVRVILDSHSNLAQYAAPETVDCITFNFGWLPAGNHQIFTKPQTSIPAIEAGLQLLRPHGLMSLCVYYGKDSGFTERDALLNYFRTIDSRRFTVIVCDFANRPNNPPFPVFILKDG